MANLAIILRGKYANKKKANSENRYYDYYKFSYFQKEILINISLNIRN